MMIHKAQVLVVVLADYTCDLKRSIYCSVVVVLYNFNFYQCHD